MKPTANALFAILLLLAAGCRVGGPRSPLTVPGGVGAEPSPPPEVAQVEPSGSGIDAQPGGGAAVAGATAAGDERDEPERGLRLRPAFLDRLPYAVPEDVASLLSEDDEGVLLAPSRLEASPLPFAFAVVLPPSENNGGENLRRRLNAAARLGAATLVLPPSVELSSDGEFLLNEVPCGFAPADIPASVVLWEELVSSRIAECGVLVEGGTGSVLFFDTAALRGAGAAEALARLERLLSERMPAQGSCTLLLDRPLWIADRPEWRDVAALLKASERTVVVAFSGASALYWEEHGGLQCIVVPQTVVGEEPGILWLSLAAAGPTVSLVDAGAASDIRRFDRQVQEDRDRLVKSLTTTALCGRGTQTTVRFQNTMEIPLDVRAKWRFGNGPVPVQPQILGFQLAPGEQFQQEFRFQPQPDQVLKFLRPRLTLSMVVPDGAGGESPLIIQAVPWCCMRGAVQTVDAEVVVDGDPSEWAGRGYPLNHETQVILGLDAWRGPADLSANLFVSRTSDQLLIGAQIYDDRHTEPDLESRVALRLAVELLPKPSATEGDAAAGAVTLQMQFVAGEGLTVVSDVEGVRSQWAQSEDALLLEAAIPLGLFGDAGRLQPVRLDASLTEPVGENGSVSLVFSGRDPELRDPSLYGRFRIVPDEGAGE